MKRPKSRIMAHGPAMAVVRATALVLVFIGTCSAACGGLTDSAEQCMLPGLEVMCADNNLGKLPP